MIRNQNCLQSPLTRVIPNVMSTSILQWNEGIHTKKSQ